MAYLPAYAFVRRLGLMVAIALFAPQAPAADKIPRETFGAESNPTGNPIGGGSGYQRPLAEPNYRVATADELLSALGQARAGEVVYVDDARQIDLTDQRGIVIPGGVTLASGRGQNDSPGALLFTTEDKDTKGAARESFCLFKTGGSGARVTGLRLRGPDPRRRVQYDYLNSNGILAKHDGLEVDNCEIYAWSHAGVFVQAGTDFHIHHNFIHHTRRLGLGYGVSIDRAEVLIEANIFDYYRHAIAASGRSPSGYEARYNITRPHATGHVFDMHGGTDRRDGTNVAGDWMKIHHNTFLANRPPVKIRGRPNEKCEVSHNWFVQSTSPGQAVKQINATGNLNVRRNAYTEDKTVDR